MAFVGAPNTGKTTLFNVLTGSTELVANWPGATVSIKYVRKRFDGNDVCLVDLPGTYSVHGTGSEEKVTREFILSQNPDLVLILADSTNLERGLFLAIDVLELFPRSILVLTKIDEAERRGIKIDVEGLSKALGIPIVAVSAVEKRGLRELEETIVRVLQGRVKLNPRIGIVVPKELQEYHNKLTYLIAKHGVDQRKAAWLAARLLEEAEWAPSLLRSLVGEAAEKILEETRRLLAEVKKRGIEPASYIAAAKYDLASELFNRYVHKPLEAEPRISRLDALFLHPVTGPVISFLMMFLVFFLTYVIATGSPLDTILDEMGLHGAAEMVRQYSLMNIMAMIMDWLAGKAMEIIPNPILAKMIGEGVLSSSYGVGLVMTFMPLIAVMMAIIGMLEDSGLVPRIAAGVDKFFRRFGVSGKAIFPAMLSLGCNVPGVLATRVIDSEEERRAVVFAVPLIPCMARFTVLLAFAHVFFPGPLRSAAVVFAVYLVAVSAFLLTLKILRRKAHAEEETEFVLELPPLKKPSIRVVWWLTWDKIKHFLIRAGTVITVFSIILWLLANFGPHGYLGENGSPSESYAAVLGRLMAPYISIIFGVGRDIAWRLGFSFLGGFVAKEVFLDAMAAVAPGAGGLAAYPLTPAQALAVMVAVTLYIPCVATLSAMYSETRDSRLVTYAFLYDMVIATIFALAVRAIASVL